MGRKRRKPEFYLSDLFPSPAGKYIALVQALSQPNLPDELREALLQHLHRMHLPPTKKEEGE
jgi:hypothetical protein